MGTLYHKSCTDCDVDREQSVTFNGFAGAVLSGRARGGEIIADGYLAFLNSEGELVPLPHPVEQSTLEQQGETWRRAALNGRLLRIHNPICRDCGRMNSAASLTSITDAGCLLGVISALVMVAVNSWLLKLPSFAEYLLFWLALLAPSTAIWIYVWVRFHKSAQRFRFAKCHGCGSRNGISLGRAVGKSLPCNRCGRNTMRISVAGRS
jgi:hypothetical protein